MNNELVQNKILKTEDGSVTLESSRFSETYHSTKGAVSESKHIYINAGLKNIDKDTIRVFEVGFGTGLNAILTLCEALKSKKKIYYTTIEKYPIGSGEIEQISFAEIECFNRHIFRQLHGIRGEKYTKIDDNFYFRAVYDDILNYNFDEKYDLVYFDAFSYNSQPEMWSVNVFSKLYNSLNNNGVLTTYSAKGVVKQNLRTAGFDVKRIKGYKKRHSLIAEKRAGE